MSVKKSSLIALIIFFSISMPTGQVVGQVTSSFIGIIGGQNRAHLNWEESEYPDAEYLTRSSAVFGGVLGVSLSRNFDIKLEPSYLQKGANRELDDPEMGLVKSSINLSYVELPILLQLSFNKEGINPYLIAGGTASYLLKAKQEYDDEYAEFGYEPSYDIRENLTDWDYGYSYGGGISIPLGGFSVFLEGRYNKGVSDINDIEDSDAEIFTEGMEYLAGITIPIGGRDDVFFQQVPGAPEPKPKRDMGNTTRTRERRGKCEIGAELGIRIINPLGKIITGKKKILFNVLKPGVRVDSNCQIVVQTQNSAVCPYPGTVTFTFYRGEKGQTRFHRIEGHVENEGDLKKLLAQPAPVLNAPPKMSVKNNRKTEYVKVVGQYASDKNDVCSYEDKFTVIWRYNASSSSGSWKYLNPDIKNITKRPPKWRSRIRYNPEIIEEKTGFPGLVNHATETVVDFSVDEAFSCCAHSDKYYAIIQFVRHTWKLGKHPPRNDQWNLDGPDSQAKNHKAGEPYDPTYASGGSQLISVGPWNQRGGDAITVRDYPGLFTKDHEKFMKQGGLFEWHFWTLLVCLENPSTAEQYLSDGEVQAITHFKIVRKYPGKEGKPEVVPSFYKKDRKYFDPCVPLEKVLQDRSLLEAYNDPRDHLVRIGD